VKNYQVRAKRWEHGWELHIDGVGVTQSRTLWDAEEMARDLIGRREDLPEDAFTVTITPEIGGGLDEETRAAREAVSAANRAQRQAAAQSRAAARRLRPDRARHCQSPGRITSTRFPAPAGRHLTTSPPSPAEGGVLSTDLIH